MNILDNKIEDRLWFQLSQKSIHQIVLIAVFAICLLKDHLVNVILTNFLIICFHSYNYVYQNSEPFMLCGDFNARCGSDADYMEGVDDIEPRSIVNYCKNSYGDILIDFLINCNCIVINGRGKGSNDYTSISSKGVIGCGRSP